MKTNQSIKSRVSLSMAIIPMLLMGCIFTTLIPGGTDSTTEGTREATPVPYVFSDADFDYGSGPFTLADTTVGLDGLTSYRAILTMTFDGENGGSTELWTRTYTATVSRLGTPFVQLVVESSGVMDGEALSNNYKAEVERTRYRQAEGEECVAEIYSEGSPAATGSELAQGLPSLHGADEAGSEEIDGVQSQHYTFDALAMGLSGMGTGEGEVWVAADDGGYVMKYSASYEGSEEYFGEGISGTITWEYELLDIDQPVTLELPADCPLGRVPAPIMVDASDIVEELGDTSYSTPSSIEAVIDFYVEQMPALGWEAPMDPLISEGGGQVSFEKEGRQITIVIFLTDEGTSVTLLIELIPEPFIGD